MICWTRRVRFSGFSAANRVVVSREGLSTWWDSSFASHGAGYAAVALASGTERQLGADVMAFIVVGLVMGMGWRSESSAVMV